MEKEDFVPYEIALKFEGYFDKKDCIATIDQTEYLHINKTRWPVRGAMMYNTINCPTYQQVFRRFREEELYGLILPTVTMHWTFKIVNLGGIEVETSPYKKVDGTDYSTYQEAQDACLIELNRVFVDSIH